jgi:mRNA interferase RelE/StbE
MYEVVLSAEGQKIYASADQALAKKIARCFEQLEQSPRYHPNIKPLKGDFAGYYRYRIGDYRSWQISIHCGATTHNQVDNVVFKYYETSYRRNNLPFQ